MAVGLPSGVMISQKTSTLSLYLIYCDLNREYSELSLKDSRRCIHTQNALLLTVNFQVSRNKL